MIPKIPNSLIALKANNSENSEHSKKPQQLLHRWGTFEHKPKSHKM